MAAVLPKIKCSGFRNTDKKVECVVPPSTRTRNNDLYNTAANILVPMV